MPGISILTVTSKRSSAPCARAPSHPAIAQTAATAMPMTQRPVSRPPLGTIESASREAPGELGTLLLPPVSDAASIAPPKPLRSYTPPGPLPRIEALYVLTYHSHHIAGADYATNDHVALAVDLPVIDAAGYRIVPLAELLDLFLAMQRNESIDPREWRVVALTFDDGPEYDAVDHHHPSLGVQPSFLRILDDFASRTRQTAVCGTSFVIASPAARRCMEAATGPGPYYLHEGALNDDWWLAAIDSGRLAIANHSWDHLHPGLPRVAHSRQVKGDFTSVDNAADADLQIDAATRFIDRRTGGRAAPFFAYPFGQYSRYLVEEYFPRTPSSHGLRAAFTVDARPLRVTENRWSLPRYSCGYNWSSPGELAQLLANA